MIALLLASCVLGPQANIDPAVLSWIRENAHPLKTVVAESGFDDLQPLKKIIGKARVVSMGESTHGTREIFQMKHRMLEFLVKEMGFTTFALESNYRDCLRVNDYVLYGKGDVEAALESQSFWTCGSEEMLDMIRWMRRHNANPKTKRKVSFYGIDIRRPRDAAQFAIDFIRECDSNLAKLLEPMLEILPNADQEVDLVKPSDKDWAAAQESLKPLLPTFDANRETLIRALGLGRYEDARQSAVVANQAMEMYDMIRNYPIAFLYSGPDFDYFAQDYERSAALLRTVMSKVPASLTEDLDELLNRGTLQTQIRQYYLRAPEFRAKRQELAKRVLAAKQQILDKADDKPAMTKALQDIEALFPFLEKYGTRRADAAAYVEFRDRCMADNVLWLLKRDGHGARVMTWAHNRHVSKFGGLVSFQAIERKSMSLGGFLAKQLGEDQVIVGFSVNKGSLQAYSAGAAKQKYGSGLKGFNFGPAALGTLDHTLSIIGQPMYYLDLRNAKDKRVESWLDTASGSLSVGASFDPDDTRYHMFPTLPRKSFDVIIYLDETSRAIPSRLTREKYKITDLTPVNPRPKDHSPASWVPLTSGT